MNLFLCESGFILNLHEVVGIDANTNSNGFYAVQLKNGGKIGITESDRDAIIEQYC